MQHERQLGGKGVSESPRQPGMMCSLTSAMMAFQSSPSSGALSGNRGARYPGSTCNCAILEGLMCATSRQGAFRDGTAAQVNRDVSPDCIPASALAGAPRQRGSRRSSRSSRIHADGTANAKGIKARALFYNTLSVKAHSLHRHVIQVMHRLPPPRPLDVRNHELHEKIRLHRCCDHCWQVLPSWISAVSVLRPGAPHSLWHASDGCPRHQGWVARTRCSASCCTVSAVA